MKINKPKKGILILVIFIFILLIMLIDIFTFPNYEKAVAKFDDLVNYNMKVELNIDDNIKSYINTIVDNEKKASINHFYAVMNDIDYSYKFFTYYDKNKYSSYKEQATQYINIEIDKPEYMKLVNEIKKLKFKDRIFEGNVFKYASYTSTVDYKNISDILYIYKEYFGINKEHIENKNYDATAIINRDGHISTIVIDLADGVTINDEKFENSTITITFNNHVSTNTDQVE
jgi:hypothetical protein